MDWAGLFRVTIRNLHSQRLCSGIIGHLWGDVSKVGIKREGVYFWDICQMRNLEAKYNWENRLDIVGGSRYFTRGISHNNRSGIRRVGEVRYNLSSIFFEGGSIGRFGNGKGERANGTLKQFTIRGFDVSHVQVNWRGRDIGRNGIKFRCGAWTWGRGTTQARSMF